MLPEDDEPEPESVMVPFSVTVAGLAVRTAEGGAWMVTVAVAAWLFTPRLSVTTKENVTVPVVLGTVTATLDVGAVVVVEGFEVVS